MTLANRPSSLFWSNATMVTMNWLSSMASMPLAGLSLMILFPLVMSMAPPRPLDPANYETVFQYRKRMNITFNYMPANVHPEYCRHLTEEECETMDRDMRRDRHGRELSISLLNPTIGTFKVLVLLIRFKDHTNRNLPSRQYFDEMLNGKGTSKINPVGSVSEFFRYNSMGKYNVVYEVRDWFTLPQTEAYYAANVSGRVGCGLLAKELFSGPLNLKDQQMASPFDWFNYDVGGGDTGTSDGYLDGLLALHSGQDAAYVDWPGCVPSDYTQRIWSQGCASSYAPDAWTDKNYYVSVGGFALASAFSDCQGNFATMGTMSHEYTHGFNLKDLYDQSGTAGSSDPVFNFGGIGKFGLMSDAVGWNLDGSHPGSHCPYSRLKNSWLAPIPIQQDGYYAIQPSEISNQIYMISQNFPAGEYLLIENRYGMKWCSDWPNGGIIIWHVDEMKAGQFERSYPGKSGWPGKHYRVSVLQADGLYDIEKGLNDGDAGDFWTIGMTLGPGGSFPNTDSIQGTRYQTGISITILTNAQMIMSFRVEGLQGYGSPVYLPTQRESPQYNPTQANQSVNTTQAVPNTTIPSNYSMVSEGTNTTPTSNTLSWILSMLGGVALVMGVMVALL